MLDILNSHLEDLGITATSAQLEATYERTVTQLTSRAAQLTVVDSKLADGQLEFTLKVIDQAGHKLPFPARRAWLHVVKDASGQVVFESGKPNADGTITGNNADAVSGTYEPHYDVITSDDQVQIYESVMADVNGDVTYILLRAGQYLKDNRILPAGFDKNSAPEEAGVYGAALTDNNFVGGSDQVTYDLALGGGGPYTIAAELLYQPVAYQYAQNLIGDEPEVDEFQSYYASADLTPVALTQTSVTASTTAPTTTAATTTASTIASDLAAAGQSTYGVNCACHGQNASLLVSKVQNYATAADLMDYIKSAMPPSNPGGLPDKTYLEILAFVLVQSQAIDPSTVMTADNLATIQLK